jgi:hypothetical protein
MSKFSYSSLLKLLEIGLLVLMHISSSMCIPQEQGLVNGSKSFCNKLQEESLTTVGMLIRKIMHLPMTRLGDHAQEDLALIWLEVKEGIKNT